MGERFYWEGLNRAGEAVPIVLQGDVEGRSNRFPCVSCHRPSGFGGSEGGQFVLPITQPILFNESSSDQERRNRRFRDMFKEKQGTSFDARMHTPDLRPAYTDETLATAIRSGMDPAGRDLAEAMPRYQLGEQTMADLIAYLKTLSAETSPGVTDDTLHLATVVANDVEPEKQKAMLDTIEVFFDWYNKDIRGQQARPGFSPYYRSQFSSSYRIWKLHVWRLEGPPSSWREQLQAYYAEQPVFAVVSGVVNGSWAPVDGFCDAKKLPCLFPNTDLPDTEDAENGYSLYFSRGLVLEAEALAAHLAQQPEPPRHIVQIAVEQPEGQIPAQTFERAIRNAFGDSRVSTRLVADDEDALAEAIASIDSAESASDSARHGDEVLVIWPGDRDNAGIAALNRHAPDYAAIVLPSTALATAQTQLAEELYDRVRLTFPYEKPSAIHPRRYRVRAWMRSQRLTVTHPRLQLQTYYALTQMQFAFDNLIADFYRDYLIEFIEHEAEANLNPGVYPSLSLGPGQRFASKGAFIMKLSKESKDGYKAVTDWIVP